MKSLYYFLASNIIEESGSLFNKFIDHKFLKLHTLTVSQMLWLLNRMMKNKIADSIELLISIARNIILEELTEFSKQLAERLCKLIEENMEFLCGNPEIITTLFFKLSKLLAGWQAFESDVTNRSRISKLLILLWERSPNDCLCIGREWLRISHTALKSSDFEYFIQKLSSKSPISE